MRLTSALKRANPIQTPPELSVRARAELRALVGPENVPDSPPGESHPARSPRRVRWLAPGAAALLAVAGIGIGLSSHSTTPYAFAETVTAAVMPGEVAPIPLGTSLIFEIPYPRAAGQPQAYAMRRVWLSVDAAYWAGWTQIPSNLTFTLQNVTDDIGFYQAENWPYDKVYEMVIVGPGSSRCGGGDLPYDIDFDEIMASTQIYLCAFALAQASPDYSPPPIDSLQMIQGGWSVPDGVGTIAVEISGTTNDPDRFLSVLKGFELGMNGRWVSVPEGYEDWAQVATPVDPCPGGSTSPLPQPGGTFAAGLYCFLPQGGDAVSIGVRDDGTCVVKAGEGHLSEVGVKLDSDGTCSYNP